MQEQLLARIAKLDAELGDRTREADEKEQQLERYAADLRETFMQERARARELHRSYMLTVRALASARTVSMYERCSSRARARSCMNVSRRSAA